MRQFCAMKLENNKPIRKSNTKKEQAMKKVMIVALAVLFTAGVFAQNQEKPAAKKEPAKTEQKATGTQTAAKPAEHHTATTQASKPAEKKHQMHSTTNKSATSKPAGQKEATKPAKN
jgi:hypothetical protein